MNALDEIRQLLAQQSDTQPGGIWVIGTNGQSWRVSALELREALGKPPVESPARWCDPVAGLNSNTFPTPPWSIANGFLARYTLAGTPNTIHTGADIDLLGKADLRRPVYALTTGEVLFSGIVPNSTWMGLVIIRHDHDGTYTVARYAHLTGLVCKAGDKVRPGQVIGLIGDPGKVFPPHLHLDLGKMGDPWFLQAANWQNWPSAGNTPPDKAEQFVRDHYQNPEPFLKPRLSGIAITPVPVTGLTYRVAVSDGLNVRTDPRIGADTLASSLPYNAIIRADNAKSAGGYLWVQITQAEHFEHTVGLWCAIREERSGGAVFLVNPSTPTSPPAPPARSGLTIGLHLTAGPVSNALIPMLERLAKAGKHVPVVTIVNNGMIANKIRQVSPKTVIVFRPGVMGGPEPDPIEQRIDGGAWFELRYAMAASVQFDYLQCVNEWFVFPWRTAADMQKFGTFYQQLMSAATVRGIKVTIGDIAPGNIEQHHIPAILPMLKQAAAQGHAFNYHSYGSNQDNHSMVTDAINFSLRWTRWVVAGKAWSWVQESLPGLKFVFGESGSFNPPRFRDVETTIRMMQEQHNQLRLFPQAIGSCWWTLNPTPDWKDDDFGAALGAYEAWMMTVQAK